MFSIILFKISDPVNCANKTLDESTIIATVDGTPIEDEDICNPSFLIDYYDERLLCNYVYVSKYNRYYFCSPVTENGRNIRLNCSVDALMSYWNEIANQPMTLIRSSEFGKPTYVQDNALPIDDERIWKCVSIEFDTIHKATGDDRIAGNYFVVNTI